MLINKFWEGLPLYKEQDVIVDKINDVSHKINSISGEPGCGKTLLVPQILYEQVLCDKNDLNIQRIYVVLRSKIDEKIMAKRKIY